MKEVWLTNFEYRGINEQSHLISETAPSEVDILELVKLGCKEVYGEEADLVIEDTDTKDNKLVYDIYDRENTEYVRVSVIHMNVVKF